jgi:hypothetical protein
MDLDLHSLLSEEDWGIAVRYIGSLYRPPDLTIAPDGEPYIYRWYVTPRSSQANVYFHVQVKDDPDRPLHDHPWDNMSTILAGGYIEHIQSHPPHGETILLTRRPGDVVFRRAKEAHRLFMPAGVPYTMTQFTTGPKIRSWGFWDLKRGWLHNEDTVHLVDGKSVSPKENFS